MCAHAARHSKEDCLHLPAFRMAYIISQELKIPLCLVRAHFYLLLCRKSNRFIINAAIIGLFTMLCTSSHCYPSLKRKATLHFMSPSSLFLERKLFFSTGSASAINYIVIIKYQFKWQKWIVCFVIKRLMWFVMRMFVLEAGTHHVYVGHNCWRC